MQANEGTRAQDKRHLSIHNLTADMQIKFER